jgi:hypothetical protein
MSRLLETYIPSIGFDPQKKFAPGLHGGQDDLILSAIQAK